MADFTQDIVLDADGKPVFSALDYINAEVAKLQKTINLIGKDSYKNVSDVGKVIAQQTKDLQTALSQLRTLTGAKAAGNNTAGSGIQDLNASKRLATQTVAATNYAKSLGLATTAVEGLRAKLNELDRAAAERGKRDQAETLTNSRRREQINEQIKQLRLLDTELAKLERRAGRTNGDFSSARSAVSEARKKLEAVALTPNKFDLKGPLAVVTAAQDAYAAALDRTRAKQAEALTQSRAYYRQLEQDAVKARDAQASQVASAYDARAKTALSASTIAKQKADDYERALKAVADQRAAQEAKGFLGNDKLNRAAAAGRLSEQEKLGAQQVMALNKQALDQDRAADAARVASAKAVSTARLEAAKAGVVERARAVRDENALIGEQARAQENLRRLRAEAKRDGVDPERRTMLAQLIELEKTYNNELTKTSAELRKQKSDAAARLSANNNALVPDYARGQISSLGGDGAREAAKRRILTLTEQLKVAEVSEQGPLREALVLEQRRSAEIERQIRDKEREQRGSTSGRIGTAAKNTLLYGAVAGLGYGAFNAISQGISELTRLEDEFVKLQAISNSTDLQMQSLKSTIFEIGASSRFSLVDLAKISQTLAQAGVSAGEMDSVLRSVTTLATSSGSTPDEAVNLVTSALGSFQLQSSEAARVADLLTSALNRTKLTVGQVGQAIQYVGATAFEQNISLEQLLATVGAVSQAGIRSGSTIGTGFRQFLVDLQNPSEKLTAQLDALGIKAADVDVSVRGLPAVLETLAQKGFGAGQAYAGLETRAAAFYLTAKNNVDIMDQLQLSFATSGAAAIANDRAMNSLTAQWQRFKNIIADTASGPFADITDALKNTIQYVGDLIDKMNEYQRVKAGDKATLGQAALTSGGYAAAGAGIGAAGGALIGGVGAVPGAGIGALGGFFYGNYKALTAGQKDAAAGARDLATNLANSTDKVNTQTNQISELEKELQRLIVQKESLANNDLRSAAETANLTARFAGLASYLDSTKTRYNSLTDAVRAFTAAQTASLTTDLNANNSDLQVTKATASKKGGTLIRQVLANKGAERTLTAEDRAALRTLLVEAPSSKEGQKAVGVLSGDQGRIAKLDLGLSRQINDIVQAAQTVTTSASSISTNTAKIAANSASLTPIGVLATDTNRNVQSLITQLGSADRAAKGGLASQANGLLNALDKKLATARPRADNVKGDLQYIKDQRAEVASLRQQIVALTGETAAEKKAREAAVRESEKKPKVTQSDLDAIGLQFGLGLGSGRRSAAEQNALFKAGKTKATAETGSHSRDGGVARDFKVGGLTDEEAEGIAAAMRAAAKAAGIDAFIQFESGKGKNNGSGRHIHANVKPGTRLKKDRTLEVKDDYGLQLANDQLALDEENLKKSLRAIGKTSTDEAFSASINAAQLALDQVNADLKDAAIKELRSRGQPEGSTLWKAKMLQVQQAIDQNISEFQTSVADGITKTLAAQMKAAQETFEAAIAPAQAAVAIAQSTVSGLDYFSNDGLVPDYIKTLAQRRKAAADENLDRSRLAALPNEIQSAQNSLSSAESKLKELPLDTPAYTQGAAAVQEYTNKLTALRTERDALATALNAGTNNIPTTINGGLQAAIEAYTQVNNLNNTFKQDIINNLGGAVETVGSSFSDMFTNVLNGSQTALQAFGGFAKGIMQYVQQLAAKLIASKIFGLLLKLGTAALGGGPGSDASIFANSGTLQSFGSFNGGPAFPEGLIKGGEVTNGSTTQDSVNKRLARGEWVVQKKAVDSVGPKFMAQLNRHGASALSALNSVPQIAMAPKQEMSIYVVAPDQKPQLGKNDILLAVQQDILSGGETKKLIKYVGQGG